MNKIIEILNKFQKGYDESNKENVTAFMKELFSNRQDLLVLGTGSYEVCIGRDEVSKLIYNDWDGGWGDFKIDIEGAKVEAENDIAWFYADCTVKYRFEDFQDNNNEWQQHIDYLKQVTEKENSTPIQKLSFLNWMMALRFHKRKPGNKEYLWQSEISGMLVKEDDAWRISTLHFAMAKSNFPDQRLEDTVEIEDIKADVDSIRNKIVSHYGSKADDKLINLLRELEVELAADDEFGGISFDSEQVLIFDAGQFSWIIALGTTKKNISEDEIFEKSLKEIKDVLQSDFSLEDKLFRCKRSIAYSIKEASLGTEFTWLVRLTAVVEKIENGYQFRHKHFSYPFYWILEGKL